ncbi:MAG: hypothetical protein QOE62_792 [Actinomycetota bacterium]|nr:hypothetical protein [Actinomycetota bacterium]
MRTRLSIARRSLASATAVVGVALAPAMPVVTMTASSAQAALAPVVGCGFHFGPIGEQGAAGTEFLSVVLRPANSAQRCTTAVTFTATATPSSTAPRYTTIDNNPITATQTVSFAPGRLPPLLTIAWQGFHCADPAVAGVLTFASGGQSASIGITPSSCFAATGGAHSNFASFPTPPLPSAVGIARTPSDHGYRTVTQTGALTHEGDATAFTTAASHAPVVGIASTPTGNGTWVVADDGGVFAYGSATFFGSLGATHLNQPVVGLAPTPSGHGYWLAASDGGVFSFGDAAFHGSLGAIHLNAPVVGITATPSGHGYWLTASDGGVFAFGDATFAGSLGSVLLNAPIVGITAGPHGGYWLVGSDGSVFAFGGVPFKGSLGAVHLNAPVSGMTATSTGKGYWLVGADNGVFAFGDAHFFGSMPITFP